VVGGFADANAGSDLDPSRVEVVVANPQTGGGRGEIARIVAGAGDAEGLRQASGTAGEFGQILRAPEDGFSSVDHVCDAEEGFEGAEENGSGLALAFAGDVEAVVVAVDEINVGVAGRTEQDRGAGSIACESVGRGIVFPQVGFDFDDAGGDGKGAVAADKDLAEKGARYSAGIVCEEGAR